MKIPPSELPLQPGGEIYHLGITPQDLANTVILVGDPDRVPTISAKFDTLDFTRQNREIVTHTGTLRNKRITVLSTGMGTDNIDIVLTELDALVNIDLQRMEVKPAHQSLNLIRIGTCGSLQADIPVNSFVAAAYGLGLDGLLHYYKHDASVYQELVSDFITQTHWDAKLPQPYCFSANPELLEQIAFDMYHGITASAQGFFGPQGREVRAAIQYPALNKDITQFSHKGLRVTNLEMECSAIYGLGHLLKHRTLTVCMVVANRITNEFSKDYHQQMDKLIDTVLTRVF